MIKTCVNLQIIFLTEKSNLEDAYPTVQYSSFNIYNSLEIEPMIQKSMNDKITRRCSLFYNINFSLPY